MALGLLSATRIIYTLHIAIIRHETLGYVGIFDSVWTSYMFTE